MPAMLPPYYKFLDVGPVFIDGEHKKNLTEVSTDGKMECLEENCQHHDCTKKMVTVENKCPYPTGNIPHEPYSTVIW